MSVQTKFLNHQSGCLLQRFAKNISNRNFIINIINAHIDSVNVLNSNLFQSLTIWIIWIVLLFILILCLHRRKLKILLIWIVVLNKALYSYFINGHSIFILNFVFIEPRVLRQPPSMPNGAIINEVSVSAVSATEYDVTLEPFECGNAFPLFTMSNARVSNCNK